jgi:hypothetical protein
MKLRMNSTMNKYIIKYKTCSKKDMKKQYLNFFMTENTKGYNEYKNILKHWINKDQNDHRFNFYTLRMKNHMSEVLLYNSILKNNKENIIKSFNDFNKLQLDYMESMEEATENEKIKGFVSNLNDEITKPGEKYRLICIDIKEKYEGLKYIIEDYNNIKL